MRVVLHRGEHLLGLDVFLEVFANHGHRLIVGAYILLTNHHIHVVNLVESVLIGQGLSFAKLPGILLIPLSHRQAATVLDGFVTAGTEPVFQLVEGVVVSAFKTVDEVLRDFPVKGSVEVVFTLVLATPVVVHTVLEGTGSIDVLLVFIFRQCAGVNLNLVVESEYRTGHDGIVRTDLVRAATGTHTLGLGVSQAYAEVQVQVLHNLVLQLEVHVVTTIAVSFHQTVVVGVGAAQRVLCLVRTTTNADVVAGRNLMVAEHLFLPVVTRLILVEVQVVERAETLLERADSRVAL